MIDIRRENRSQIRRLLNKRMVSIGHGREIPYRLFFMSRNLEHALSHRIESLDDVMKADLADERNMYYSRNPERLMTDLLKLYSTNLPEGIELASWRQTWDYAMDGLNSLKPNSNLVLLKQYACLLGEA
ncbi:hypothetical protein [Bifidobacterium sp. SO1]|uniref:hypothetical protein n=1 Tax=Bifidobacterium sp. SO1 TaxID=2809029 RepID=UPI001BDD379A|nr:hypothetical protein [Bifidobacterium sp. SO1]MBT1161826.1 hypothetical protein [Bifidobacterium sp. SO1]